MVSADAVCDLQAPNAEAGAKLAQSEGCISESSTLPESEGQVTSASALSEVSDDGKSCASSEPQRIPPFAEDGTPQDFHWTTQAVSHSRRRRLILEKHPEIEQLYGYSLLEGVVGVATTLLNLYIGFKIVQLQLGWPAVLLAMAVVSGTINHSLFLAMHEASHMLVFPRRWMNDIFAIFTNLSMGTPAAISFTRYHLDHHVYTGVDVLDPDIPTEIEGRLFTTPLGKFIFVLLFPLTYTLRPMLRCPKKLCFMEVINWTVVVAWDLFVYKTLGWKGIAYFVGGAFFSMSFHPLNGHLIAEHYQFPEGEKLQETYSTYGWENLLTFNAGYHLEHHDFPRVPGCLLPKVHQIAKEFYDLPHHTTWVRVVWDFIMKKEVNPYSRVKRVAIRGGEIPFPHQQFVADEKKDLGAYWCEFNKTQANETKKAK
ncbi:sphingolipid delta 4 desaturase/c-4 hydroxylase protein des2 family protein [Besnoitia besnoiti]|uniref:sphingolipid 4-desaturase n=1 Tax=Besnoitia besnoiti TaxID=94643 RepID=A0A2A9MLG0_BESBE|nr:sphingolipid delta 4 desaturase/c-4 hydroxylase protein des2 family protein [Besnoitia besnoiti]PFH37161.1 sphingolipid delta 4 desaturase/c-4 hydroxylase protein des2 family protein [Besnoitia besnoiti]